MTSLPISVVVTDANVLINFCHIGQLPLLGALTPYRFLVPEEVINEITEPAQQTEVGNALAQELIARTVIDSVEALALFGTLRDLMGRGEAACLALAVTKGWMIASDEKRRFRREVVERIGAARLVGTASLLRHAISIERVSVAEADSFKAALEARRFVMPFASFGDLA